MVLLRHRGQLALAALLCLLAGCATGTRPASSAGDAQPGESVVRNDRSREVDDRSVRAHAHYAQGMIYDLDDQEELAEQEFAKAADLDPANTDLVLELSRRYVQEKAPEKALSLLQKAAA